MTTTPRTDERANNWESTDGQWVSADFARQLEREISAEREQLAANHAATRLMGKWLEAERELADRLADHLDTALGAFDNQEAPHVVRANRTLAAWKETRSGTL